MVKVKANSQRKQPPAANPSPDGSDQRKSKKASRRYGRRLLVFWLRNSAVAVGILFLAYFAFLAIWQLYQPPIPYYFVSRSDLVSRIAGISEAGEADNFLRLKGGENGLLKVETPPPKKLGGPLGNVLAIQWTPLVFVDNNKQLRVYQPSDSSLAALQPLVAEDSDGKHSWELKKVLEAFAVWANKVPFDNFVPGRLVFPRKKTLVVFCDFHQIFHPERIGLEFDFAHQLEQKKQEILSANSNVDLVLVTSNSYGQVNLWEPGKKDSGQTIFASGLQALRNDKLKFDLRTMWYGQTADKVINGLVQRVHDRGTQLTFPQTPACIRSDNCHLEQVYWGHVKAIGNPSSVEPAETADDLDKCWEQLQQHEAYWLMEDPENLSKMARKLLVLEQLWLAGFYPSNSNSDSIVAQVLKELEQGLKVKSKENAADISYYSTTLNQLRKSGSYWDFWDKLDVPEPSENLTEDLTKKLEEQPKRGKLTTVREWNELLKLQDELRAELSEQDQLLLSEEAAKKLENFQESLYVRRIAHEMPNISEAASKDIQQAILLSIRCRNAINLWAAALTPTEPLVNSVNDEIKKLQDWDADRRLLEDLLFAGAINLPEFVNRSSFRTNALQKLNSNESSRLSENFKTLLDAVESDLKSQITKIKAELQSRRDTIRQQFAQHWQWYLITRHWGREGKIPEGPEFDKRLTIAKDGNSVRQLTAYLMAYQTEADKRREYRKSIVDEQTIDSTEKSPNKPNSTELQRPNPDNLSKVILFDKNPIKIQVRAELTSQASTDNEWLKTQRNRVYLDFWWTPEINNEPYFKWASKPALGALDQSDLDKLKPLILENRTAQKLDVTATWPPSLSSNLLADGGLKEDDWGTGVFRYGTKNEALPIKLNEHRKPTEATEENERKSIEVYFRGYTKRDTIRGPQPTFVEPIVHSKEVKVKVDSGPKPLIAEKSEEVIVKLIEPRKVNVRFLLDGSGSMEKDWEFVAPSTGENNEKEVNPKKPKERLIDELNKFVDAYEKDDLLKIQFLLFSKGDFSRTKWKSWQSPKQEKEFGTSKATFTASFWQFPEKLSAVPSDYKLLKEGIKTIKFGGDTPLEYGLNLAANLLEASTKEQESLLIVISDGCEQPVPQPSGYSILSDGSWSNTFKEDGKEMPVRAVRKIDFPKYKTFMNNWSDSNSAVLFGLNNPTTIDRRKYQIYYYNFLDETTIDFESEELTDAENRESLKKVFFPVEKPTENVPVGDGYELDELYSRIRWMKQRFPERNRIKTLGDIEEIVRPRHEVCLSRDASRKQDRYLARGTKEQFDGKPDAALGADLSLFVKEGRNQNPTPEVELPVRGAERYHLQYSEVNQKTTPVASNPDEIWNLGGSDTETISTSFPLVINKEIVGRPDFVFVDYQQNKDVKHRAILQDNQWKPDSESNNVKLTLRPATQATFGDIDKNAIVHVVRQKLEHSLKELWRDQISKITEQPKASELIRDWVVVTRVDDKSAIITFKRSESSEIGVDSDSKLPSDLIVQAIDPSTGRLPSLQRIQRVTREFSYLGDQLTKVEVTFIFVDRIPPSFVWGLTDLDTVRQVTGSDGESIADWNKRVQK